MPRAIRSLRAALTVGAAIAVCALFLPPPAAAEDLDAVLAEVYRSNPTIEAARAEQRGEDEAVPRAQSNWRPTVRVEGTVSRTYDERQGRAGERTTDRTPGTAALDVRQPIYEGGSNFAELSRARNAVRAARMRLEAATQDVLLRAVDAYLAVWRDERVLRFNEANVDALREQLDATLSRAEEGFVTDTDVSQARTRLSQARARLEDARAQVQNSVARFVDVVGRPPGDLETVRRPDILPADRAAALARARASAPSVERARFAARASENAVRRAEGDLLPSLSLRGRLSTTRELGDDGGGAAATSDRLDRDSASVSLELSIPLYQAGAVTSRVREAKSAANRRQIQVAEALRAAAREADTAWNRYAGARAQVDELTSAAESARRALAGVEAEHRAGTRTVLDILDAERELVNARVDLARAEAEADLAAFSLLRAVGRLAPEPLDLPVAPYDAEAHAEAVNWLFWGLDPPADGR